MGVGVQRHAPAALPPGKTRYPLYRRMGGPQGRSGQVRKISPPPGFDPRPVQPLASRYTDCAIPALLEYIGNQCLFLSCHMPRMILTFYSSYCPVYQHFSAFTGCTFYLLCTFVFCMNLRINHDYFAIRH